MIYDHVMVAYIASFGMIYLVLGFVVDVVVVVFVSVLFVCVHACV